jgi:hypothetical protein
MAGTEVQKPALDLSGSIGWRRGRRPRSACLGRTRRRQPRRLRRPATRLRGLTAARGRGVGIGAVDASSCPTASAAVVTGQCPSGLIQTFATRRQLQGGCSELIDTPCCAPLGAGPRQGNPRDKLCGRQPSTPEGRPRQPRTNTRECGSQPAHQSLLTVVSAALSPALRNSHTPLTSATRWRLPRHAEKP